MATDSSLPVRRAILAALKDDEPMVELVPAADIHPQSPSGTPNWPFTRYGGPTVIPLRAACVDGCEVTTSVHGFAKPRYNGAGAMIETAEDHAARIGSAIAKALGGRRLDLGLGYRARITWTGSQLLQDGAEADAYHTVQNFRVRVLT